VAAARSVAVVREHRRGNALVLARPVTGNSARALYRAGMRNCLLRVRGDGRAEAGGP